ncbi:MAG: hypothetical protein ACR2IJ_07010 [Fluviibacter sp.]
MPFLLDGNPTQGEISEAVNYLLSNFSQSVVADPSTGQIIGPSGEVTGYLYKYMFVKYADSFDGSVNFSNSPTGRSYYGIRNSDSSTESTNPADYIWTQVTGGFGSTKYLWYIITGGRQISFQVSTTQPNPGWVQDGGSAIDLDYATTAVSSPANFVVIRVANNSAAPTNSEVVAAIGRDPIDGDLCIVNYNSGIYSIQYRYSSGWSVFQKVITGDLVVASSIVGSNIAASTITGSKIAAGTITSGNIAANTITASNIATNTITVNEINNVATGQIIAGSFNLSIIKSVGTNTFVVPAYVYKLKVTIIGAGGGGAPGSTSIGAFGPGGGGGGACINIFAVTPGQSISIFIGSGGSSGGGNGSASTVTATGVSMIAYGGTGGTNSSVGAGGASSGGILNFTGSNGGGTGVSTGGSAPTIGVTSSYSTNAVANSGAGGGGGYPGYPVGSGGSGLCIIEY